MEDYKRTRLHSSTAFNIFPGPGASFSFTFGSRPSWDLLSYFFELKCVKWLLDEHIQECSIANF